MHGSEEPFFQFGQRSDSGMPIIARVICKPHPIHVAFLPMNQNAVTMSNGSESINQSFIIHSCFFYVTLIQSSNNYDDD